MVFRESELRYVRYILSQISLSVVCLSVTERLESELLSLDRDLEASWGRSWAVVV